MWDSGWRGVPKHAYYQAINTSCLYEYACTRQFNCCLHWPCNAFLRHGWTHTLFARQGKLGNGLLAFNQIQTVLAHKPCWSSTLSSDTSNMSTGEVPEWQSPPTFKKSILCIMISVHCREMQTLIRIEEQWCAVHPTSWQCLGRSYMGLGAVIILEPGNKIIGNNVVCEMM